MSSPQANILIVDDLPANLLALEEALSGLGHRLVRASSGQEALEKLLTQEFAVILLDVRMPEMDGLETAKYIRQYKRTQHTPIIFITAGDENVDDAVRGYSAGAVDYITKPFPMEILRSKVKMFVDLYLKGKALTLKTDELLQANGELRTAYQQLETFSYTVAHNLRAPLRSMSGFSQILREEYSGKPFDETGQNYALRIEQGAQQMDSLIGDLLAYCHIAHHRVTLAKVDPGSIIKAVLNRAAPLLDPTCEVQVSEPIPAVTADPHLFQHVITQLVSNAGKFSRPEVTARIQIRPETARDKVRIWIEDNGIGIDPRFHDLIFGTFERLKERTDVPGAGIGLAIVKMAMERMGGRVGLESEPGKGSRFWIDFHPAH